MRNYSVTANKRMSPSPSGSAFAEMESSIPNGFSGIIIGGNAPLSRVLTEKLTQARMRGARIYTIPDFYENFWFKIPVFHLHDRWFVFSHGFDLLHNPVWRKLKRLMDVALAAVFLAALSPVMLIAALAVKLTSPGPILYSQTRTGLNDREFKVYKFRTMRPDAEKNGPQWTATHDERITKIGRFLRVTHLDELPQVWNVLKGEMSFIGPRPERPEFNKQLEREIPYYGLRHLVKPGITGWAQVMRSYGSSLAWPAYTEDSRDKLEYDLYYLKNYSFMLDLAIVFKTFRVVVFGKGR